MKFDIIQNKVASVIVLTLTLGLGTWLMISPIRERLEELQLSEFWVGLTLIIIGVYLAHKFKLKK